MGASALAGELVVIKLGGAAAEPGGALTAFAAELAQVAQAGARVVWSGYNCSRPAKKGMTSIHYTIKMSA